MIDRAYGKINISIDVIGKRIDGYHLLDMIMVPIDIYDLLTVEVSDTDSFYCNIDLPWDNSNTLFKALYLFKDVNKIDTCFAINLQKNIPIQAGLAGGSSDAASLLRILNKLCKTNLSENELASLACKVGSDVPYCIYQRCSRVSQTGEIVKPFDFKQEYYCLLIKPEKGINTKECYQKLDINKCDHGNIDTVLKNFTSGKEDLGLFNSLEYSSFSLLPEIKMIKDKCLSLGYQNTLMSGSGSTIFVLEKDKNKLQRLKKEFKNGSYYTLITTIKKN